ncbi:MAG: bacillithiol biosynthesis cysteine-adding enzyme BshC [Cryomorphaceae bacterium]|nr:bacillithiol biosynthesis cysteine-adding enzyme BshC [Flavobacteriales bacterium]
MNTETLSKNLFSKQEVSYDETGFFSKIVTDYLSGDKKLKSFYGRLPELDSFRDQIASKSDFAHREVLVSSLKRQYGKVKTPPKSIDKLTDNKTFTVTTGHQVCLFTGPLYVIYKIVTVVNTCKALKAKFPEYDFVPVFWMATEDHDFEEANHFVTNGKKIEWESGQGGAVGRMKPEGMDAVVGMLKDALGMGYFSGELIALFERAYEKHDTISEATRYLIQALFGDEDVICIDGDDPELKALAVPVFIKELREKFSFKAVSRTNDELRELYNLQVHSREVNLFYLGEQLRERIVQNDDGDYEVLNTRLSFTVEEIENELKAHPERFSPNVILRPLYQEVILPNLAYVGGGGELAYWFQLKGVFDEVHVSFPILLLRNSVLIASEKSTEILEKLGLEWRDVFRTTHELEERLIKLKTDERMNLDLEREKLEMLFLDIETRLGKIESTLEKSVRSGYARTDRIFLNLEKKMIRAEKKKQEILIQRIEMLKKELFPMDGLQERIENFSSLYAKIGEVLIDHLLKELNPFDKKFTILFQK